jgi:hypothetical protein
LAGAEVVGLFAAAAALAAGLAVTLGAGFFAAAALAFDLAALFDAITILLPATWGGAQSNKGSAAARATQMIRGPAVWVLAH